jgi:hypothetical protein
MMNMRTMPSERAMSRLNRITFTRERQRDFFKKLRKKSYENFRDPVKVLNFGIEVRDLAVYLP